MFDTARFEIVADRFTPKADTIVVKGEDLTGATFKMQVRDRANGGTVRADLATVVSSAAEGVRLIGVTTSTIAEHIAAGRLTAAEQASLELADDDELSISELAYRINESTMEAMPDGDDGLEADADVPLVWDMHVTPSGGLKFVAFAGDFIVKAGATE